MVHIQDGFCFLAQMFYNMKMMFFCTDAKHDSL